MGERKNWRDFFSREISFEELASPAAAFSRARRAWLLGTETLRSINRHQTLTLASALAFKTLTAIIPLLIVSLVIVSSLPTSGEDSISYKDVFLHALESRLPQAPQLQPLLDLVRQLAEHAREIIGIGFFFLLITVYSLLSSIEWAFNHIWQLNRTRPFLNRCSAYIATLIMVPVLISLSVFFTSRVQDVTEHIARFVDTTQHEVIGAILPDTHHPESTPATTPPTTDASAASTLAPTETPTPESAHAPGHITAPAHETQAPPTTPQASAAASTPQASWLTTIVLLGGSVILTCLAIAAMIYFMPYTSVKPGAALTGGLIAGILIEILKGGFRYYAAHVAQSTLAVVYGGTLLAFPLALIWLWLVWVFILLGAELSFTTQNFRDLAARTEMERRGIACRIYIAIRIVVYISERFHQGKDPEGIVDELCEHLCLPPYVVREVISTLVDANLLKAVEGTKDDAYLPGMDIAVLTVGQVARAVQHEHLEVAGQPDDRLKHFLSRQFEAADTEMRRRLDTLSFANLLRVSRGESLDPAPAAPVLNLP